MSESNRHDGEMTGKAIAKRLRDAARDPEIDKIVFEKTKADYQQAVEKWEAIMDLTIVQAQNLRGEPFTTEELISWFKASDGHETKHKRNWELIQEKGIQKDSLLENKNKKRSIVKKIKPSGNLVVEDVIRGDEKTIAPSDSLQVIDQF